MTDLEQQVMQLTQDLYVLKHTVISWKTVEERIKESNTVPEDAMIKEKKIHLEWAKAYWPQDYEVVDEMKILEEENKKLKEDVKDLVERNIELDKKYMLVLTENKKLREELSAYDREFRDEDNKAKNIYKSQKENILMWKI